MWALKQKRLNSRFQLVEFSVDKNVLYTKNVIEILQMQLRTSNAENEIRF